jgi:hypothetical protein
MGMPSCVGANATGYAGSASTALPVNTFRHAVSVILIQRSVPRVTTLGKSRKR